MKAHSTVKLIKPKRLRTPDILYELIRARKGPEHILFIKGSTFLKTSQRWALRKYIRLRVKGLAIPYTINFYRGNPFGNALICYWDEAPELAMQKEWFDREAAAGRYPDVFWYAKRHRKAEVG